MQCQTPFTAGCVVFTLTGFGGPYTYRDCCHQGTGARWSCSDLPESYQKHTVTLKQSCDFDDCNMASTSAAVTSPVLEARHAAGGGGGLGGGAGLAHTNTSMLSAVILLAIFKRSSWC